MRALELYTYKFQLKTTLIVKKVQELHELSTAQLAQTRPNLRFCYMDFHLCRTVSEWLWLFHAAERKKFKLFEPKNIARTIKEKKAYLYLMWWDEMSVGVSYRLVQLCAREEMAIMAMQEWDDLTLISDQLRWSKKSNVLSLDFLYKKRVTRVQFRGPLLLLGDWNKFSTAMPQCFHEFFGPPR